MRRTVVLVVLVALVAAPVAAAPAAGAEPVGRSIINHVLEVLTGLLSKLGDTVAPAAKNSPDDERQDPPLPLDGLGAGVLPGG